MTKVATLADGRVVDELTISGGGLTARFLTLGAILRDLRLEGVNHRLTLGAADVQDYLGNFRFGGAICGPVANRIGHARAPLLDRIIEVPTNENGLCLHGGPKGMDSQIWTVTDHQKDRLVLELTLNDQEDGWPANRHVKAVWTLPAPGTLALELTATTDAPTLFAPAQHGYWNLGPGPDLRQHRLWSSARQYNETGEGKIPTGNLPSVEGTRFDFRNGGPIGPEAADLIDHNLCVTADRGPLTELCRLKGPSAEMVISSTEPGLQLYDAVHFGTTEVIDLDGERLAAFAGLALEPQLYPDAANHPEWTSPLLLPGQTYRQETHWQFRRV